MKHIKNYLKNVCKGLAASVALLIVIPVLLLAVIIIPLMAAVGQDVSSYINFDWEDEDGNDR